MTILSLTTAAGAAYRDTVDAYIRFLWGGPMVISLGNLCDSRMLPGFAAVEDGALLGAVLYRPDGDNCEVSCIFSLVQGVGAGSALLGAVKEAAARNGARRLWLVTTNDNIHAIRFYQKRGFSLKAVHINSMDAARKLKPQIPEIGEDGIPLKHEFEFEMML